MPADLEPLFHQALALRRAGQAAAAETLFRRILARGDHADSLYLLGGTLARAGRLEEAGKLVARAIACRPDLAPFHVQLGEILSAQQAFDAAVDSYDRALVLQPDRPAVLVNRGNALRMLRRRDEALADFERALALQPGLVEAQVNRANLLWDLGRYEDAVAGYDQALLQRPNDPAALSNKASALIALGRLQPAAEACEHALRLDPVQIEALTNQAMIHYLARQSQPALAYADRALAARPDHLEALAIRGELAAEMGRPEEALAYFRRMVELDPEGGSRLGRLCLAQMAVADWSGLADLRARIVDQVRRGVQAAAPHQFLQIADLPADQLACARAWLAHRPLPVAAAVQAQPRKRLRIAYVGPDFREHPVGYLMASLAAAHDRARFEILAFSLGPTPQGPVAARIAGAFDAFEDLSALGDAQAAARLREHGVDIAVDLAGYTLNGRQGIFAHRAAPVQVNFLGYSGTLGAPYMDYIVADAVLAAPEDETGYSEAVVRLPHGFFPPDPSSAPAYPAPSRASLGLPNEEVVFCAMVGLSRIDPDTLDGWARILAAVPGSVLWLSAAPEVGVANLRREAQGRGLDPDRLVFAARVKSRPEHLARLAAADLFLNSLPYGAHSTASEALWAGLPVLTRRGEGFAGRVAASLVTAAGLPDLVCDSAQAYEAKAIALATDPAALARCRAVLAARAAPQFDLAAYARGLEAAFGAMHRRALAGLSPVAIDVAALPAID